MEREEKIAAKKMIVAAGVAVVVIIAFSVPLGSFPPLGNLLLPGGGIWNVPGEVPLHEELSIPGLAGNVTVYRDQWGIPHIYGYGENDLTFALGYCHAEDRLFFMEMARRQQLGQLSEILGPSYLASDKFNLIMGKAFEANATYQMLLASTDPTAQKLVSELNRYADGVNYYIATHLNSLPVEFQLLNIVPRNWTPVDTFSFLGYFDQFLTWDYSDIFRMNASIALGNIGYSELFGNPQPYQIPIVPDYGTYPDPTTELSVRTNAPSNDNPAAVLSSFSSLVDAIKQIPGQQVAMAQSADVGSNNWVVNGTYTSTGSPILCNDMHLDWSMPGLWYEVHLVDLSSDYDVYGFTVAGIPIVIAGHNSFVGWGFTNTNYDVLDWYYYTPVDATHYILNGTVTAYTTKEVDIKVKGQDDVAMTINYTANDEPVMSGLIPNVANGANLVLAARWTGNMPDTIFLALYGMNHAHNRAEFTAATQNWTVPAQNIIYADVYGNIAIRPTGLVPIRSDINMTGGALPSWNTGNGSMPYNGSAGEGAWIGWVPFSALPDSENPIQGYLVSANQIVAGPSYLQNYSLQSDYSDSYRAREITGLITAQIQQGSKISVDDMERIQLNSYSQLAASLAPYLLGVLNALPTKTTEEQAAINLLTGWNFVIDKDSAAPTVFMAWAEAFRDATFGDEFGAAGIPLSGDQGRMPSFAVLESLVRTNSSSHWFDNISTTTKVETMNDTIQAAFDQAMSALGTYFGNTNVAAWTWGNVNQVYFEHLTGFSAFSEGPYPANGTDETITPAWGSIWQDGKVVQNIATGGSSEREILDFSDLNNSLSVIPSGERGVSSSKHYDDQLQMFLNGQYHVSYFSANTPAKFLASWVESSILFKPAGGA